MPKSNALRNAALTALIAGAVGALLAVIYLVSALRPGEPTAYAGATRLYEAGLIVSEAVISLVFGLLALMLLRIETPSRTLAVCLAVARAVFVLWQYALHWRPGWYYIMDPADTTATSWVLIVAALVQIVAFAIAGAMAGSGLDVAGQVESSGSSGESSSQPSEP